MEGCLVRRFVLDPGWEIWMDSWSEIFDWTPDGGSGRNFRWKFCNSPRLGESEGFLVGKCEREAIGQTDRSGLGECVEWVLGGISGRPTTQRCRNQDCLLICTDTPILKDGMYCWV